MAQLEALIGLVHSENIGSRHVLEKCGFSLINQIPLWGISLSRYRLTKEGYTKISDEDPV